MIFCWFISLLTYCVAFAAYAQQPPRPLAVINIKPTDRPMQMETLKPLLRGNLTRLTGQGDWKPPSDSPATITKADYLEALKPYLKHYESVYGTEPAKPLQYSYEAVPVFAAFWKATSEQKYADLALLALKQFCLFVDDDVVKQNAEMAKTGATRPRTDNYWTYIYAYLVIPVLEMEGTPQQKEMIALLGKSLGERANAWPVYWERGAYNRPIDAAFWYDTAMKLNPNIPRAAELKAYSDMIWDDWWSHRDIEEDDPHYSGIDLMVIDAWSRVRGVDWWQDADGPNLWRHYAEQVANDGTWPAYGHGGTYGQYFMATRIAELAASRTRDGRYKWLAHRAFWNGRDRLATLVANIGYEKAMDLAMAYLYADDTVKEAPPSPGLLISKRRFRERTDWSQLNEKSLLFILHNEWKPSKLIFRGGSKEPDQFLMLQAASIGGHGHPDTGSIIHYGGDFAYYLSHGISRLDHDMEQHNMFTLREPDKDQPWKRGEFAVEDTNVPVSGQASSASYARLHIQEYPGSTTNEESWDKVLAWNGSGYPPEKAIGYRNWPVRLDRSVLFVHNQFVVVRDVAKFLLRVKAQMGQNWVVGEIGPSVGTNWVNVWTPQLFGYPYSTPPKAPMDTAHRDLLIWFVPHKEAVLQVVDGPKNSSYYGNYYINLTRRVWYPRTAEWRPEEPQAFTTVLLPHLPVAQPAKLAAAITALEDSPESTILMVTVGDTSHMIVLNSSGKQITAGDLQTDAEAALLTSLKGKPTHFSAWNATFSTMRGEVIARSEKPETVDRALN
jgi:hypothetical protein